MNYGWEAEMCPWVSGRHTASPLRTVATKELVVPRSMPDRAAALMRVCSIHRVRKFATRPSEILQFKLELGQLQLDSLDKLHLVTALQSGIEIQLLQDAPRILLPVASVLCFNLDSTCPHRCSISSANPDKIRLLRVMPSAPSKIRYPR